MDRVAGRLLLCWFMVVFGAGALAGPALQVVRPIHGPINQENSDI